MSEIQVFEVDCIPAGGEGDTAVYGQVNYLISQPISESDKERIKSLITDIKNKTDTLGEELLKTDYGELRIIYECHPSIGRLKLIKGYLVGSTAPTPADDNATRDSHTTGWIIASAIDEESTENQFWSGEVWVTDINQAKYYKEPEISVHEVRLEQAKVQSQHKDLDVRKKKAKLKTQITIIQ